MTAKEENSEQFYKEQALKACKLLTDMSKDLDAVSDNVTALTDAVKKGHFDSKKGLSILDLKNHTLLSYMTNLMCSPLIKLSGNSLNGHPVVDRLIENRIIIERLQPYETKLKHQIDKYLKNENEEGGGESADHKDESQGLTVDDFAAGETDKEDEGDDEDSGTSGLPVPGADPEEVKTYRVPKVSQNKFDDGKESEEKKEEARRRILKSSMMQDVLDEHRLEPDVIEHSNALQRKASKRRAEITRYEEENLTRVRLSKKERASLSAAPTAGAMHGELLGFSDVSLLGGTAGGGTASGTGTKRKRSASVSRKSIKAKKKRNRRMH